MNRPMIVKRVLSSLVSFLLAITILLPSGIFPRAFAADTVFAGVEDKEVAENTTFDLLQGVTATDIDGAELSVAVTNIINKADPTYVYDSNPVITVAGAGNIYEVEYTAYSGISEKHTAHRTIVSVASDASAESHGDSTDHTASADLPQPPQTLPENIQQTETAAENGLPIIFENGLHYIEDPAYPGKRIVLYCMNNQKEWPHSTQDNPNVPNYSQGYLTQDQFESPQAYQDCLRKLRKLLFAGYPYNGERLYKIVSDSKQHKPTEQEFNAMLILPPQLEVAFPYLAHHQFTLDDIGNPEHMGVLTKFMQAVLALGSDKETSNGLRHDDITAMPYYKAVNAMTYVGNNATKEEALECFAALYSDSYFVTQTQAYDATQLAVWRLLNEYGIEDNNITTLDNNKLAEVLWQYCQNGDLLTEEPKESEIRMEGDLTFTYNSKDGMWHSGTLKIIEPPSYNGLYELILPEGVTALCDGLTYVYGNEPYELVSQEKPTDTSKFTIKTHIDWLKDMKQYSPINSDKFQHMVGAVVNKTNFEKVISYSAQKDGSLRISKAVVGNTQDQLQSFNFILELSSKNFNGLYGDLEFQNGVAQFTLKNGESVTAEHLPTDATYKIIEEETNGYRVDAIHAEGTITAGKLISVVFTNTKLNDLLISKTVEGEMGDKTKKFAFLINLSNSDGEPLNGSFPYFIDRKPGNGNETETPIEEGTLTFQNGAATVYLSHGQQIHIGDIPFGTLYSIIEEEAGQNGYTTSYHGSALDGTMDSPKDVHVINSKEYVPETGIRDAGRNGAAGMICLAVIGLAIPVLFTFMGKKRYGSR